MNKKIIHSDDLLDENSYRIIEMLAKTISTKTGASYDLLYSEGIKKIENVKRNYVPNVGKNFNVYLKSCMNGYMLNYVRNNGFAIPPNRTYIDIYLKYLKYGDVQQTADRLSLTKSQVEYAIEKVQTSRHFYQLHENIQNKEEEGELSKWIIDQLDQKDKDLLEDAYINQLHGRDLKEKYGKEWKKRVEKLKSEISRLRENCN